MQVNVKIIIKQMNDKWPIICQSLTKDQIKDNSYSIDLITKNLATFEATENGTIDPIDWYDYIGLCWQTFDELFDLTANLPDEYLFNYGFYLDNFSKNLNLYISAKYEVKLNELALKFEKLSPDDQSRINSIKYQIWIIDDTTHQFLNFSHKVGLIDQDSTTAANDNYSKILQNLSESKLILLDQEMSIYSSEHFYIHDFNTKKIKPN